MSVISFNNLSFGYGDKLIYDNFSLDIQKGEIIGVLGKNGVGKSTLFKLLLGLLEPISGKCLIMNKKAKNLSPKEKLEVGILYENFITYDYLSIFQIQNLYRYFYKERFSDEIFFDFIDKLKISHKRKISTLSCGQKSQVVLALILATNPSILILDDYSLGLDAGYRSLFLNYFGDYLKSGDKTAIMTTHIVSNLDEIINKILIIQKDKTPLFMDVKEFKKEFKGYEVDKNFDTSNLTLSSTLMLKNSKKIYGFFDLKDFNALNMDFEEAFLGLVGRY